MHVTPDLCNYLIKNGSVKDEADFKSKVTDRINEVMKLTFLQIRDRLDRKFGSFELFGFDFMLDKACNPQLLEINVNPALFLDTEVQAAIIPSLIKDICNMALDIHDPYSSSTDAQKAKEIFESYQKARDTEASVPHRKYHSLDYTFLYSD
jgi:hypothetical protein